VSFRGRRWLEGVCSDGNDDDAGSTFSRDIAASAKPRAGRRQPNNFTIIQSLPLPSTSLCKRSLVIATLSKDNSVLYPFCSLGISCDLPIEPVLFPSCMASSSIQSMTSVNIAPRADIVLSDGTPNHGDYLQRSSAALMVEWVKYKYLPSIHISVIPLSISHF
jgi:hypothetical protein